MKIDRKKSWICQGSKSLGENGKTEGWCNAGPEKQKEGDGEGKKSGKKEEWIKSVKTF